MHRVMSWVTTLHCEVQLQLVLRAIVLGICAHNILVPISHVYSHKHNSMKSLR